MTKRAVQADWTGGVIVLGVFRSGTSLTCAMLSRLGVDFGPTAQLFVPAKENPLGYFQRPDIRDVNDRFIISAKSDTVLPDHPRDLALRGDTAILREADLSWREPRRLWGLKDPRLCVTLLGFVRAGLIDPERLRLVHVTRAREATVRSAMKFHMIRNRTHGSEEAMRQMLDLYERYAQWHIETLQVPTLEVDFDRLVGQPHTVAAEMSSFLSTGDRRAIRWAMAAAGKRKALLLYRVGRHLDRWTVRAPRKAWRILRRGVVWPPAR